ncbi:MAG: hypothetical protein IKR42_02595, partial [Campylobacter sp.]|nr:hypothetical protein [Campylobacter sp.]
TTRLFNEISRRKFAKIALSRIIFAPFVRFWILILLLKDKFCFKVVVANKLICPTNDLNLR